MTVVTPLTVWVIIVWVVLCAFPLMYVWDVFWMTVLPLPMTLTDCWHVVVTVPVGMRGFFTLFSMCWIELLTITILCEEFSTTRFAAKAVWGATKVATKRLLHKILYVRFILNESSYFHIFSTH
jgi:hypothetical protein